MVDFPKGFNELAHAFLERFSSAVAQTLTLVSREGPEVTRFVQKFCLSPFEARRKTAFLENTVRLDTQEGPGRSDFHRKKGFSESETAHTEKLIHTMIFYLGTLI